MHHVKNASSPWATQDQSNSKMGDHLASIHFVFFSVAEILGKFASWNFRKTQLQLEILGDAWIVQMLAISRVGSEL